MTSDESPPNGIPVPRPRRARRKAPFRQLVERAFKAAKDAGVPNPVVRVELPDGATIVVSSALPTVASSTVDDLDRELAEFERRHGHQA